MADSSPEAVGGAFSSLPEERLELGEGFLDGVEVGAVGREVEQARPNCFDGSPDARALVAAEVVHDDDIAGP